jgi:anti-sigma regulatory factor (Ser/Thr protein kinase)
MRIVLPNSAHLQNLEGFFRKLDLTDKTNLVIESHPRYVHVHPAVLAMIACAAKNISARNGIIDSRIAEVRSLPYLIRMGLFRFLGTNVPQQIQEHEESGRFIPITQIKSSEELGQAITNMIPLLHAPPVVADPIKYVFSELVRNVLEHACSLEGAFVCAQYYKDRKRLSIGIADGGIGIYQSIRRNHAARTPKEAIALALRPGISGATPHIGGNESNAGAGLFFTKSIAALSRNYFVIYSDDCLYKLLRGPENQLPLIQTNPSGDYHRFTEGLPKWQGTVVGININVEEGQPFHDLLSAINRAYTIDMNRRKKDYYKRIKFV